MKTKNPGRPRWTGRMRARAMTLALAGMGLAPAARAGTTVLLPSISKAFSPAIIGAAGTTTLTFTLTNPAGAPEEFAAFFTDTLPTGLIVASPAAVGGTCSNAAAATVATPGGGTITVSSLHIAAGPASCTVTVNVTNAEGQFNPSCASSPIAFTNSSSNVTTINVDKNITASCVTVLVPILSKAFSPTTINDGESTVLTFTLANPAGSPASSIVGFSDTLPSGLMVANPPAVGGTCANAAAATTATAGGGIIQAEFLDVPAGAASCTVTVNVTNKAGQGNTNCSLNPSGFTNFAANLSAANATVSSEPACLVVNGVAPPPAPVPAASPAVLALLAGLLGAAGLFFARRRSG